MTIEISRVVIGVGGVHTCLWIASATGLLLGSAFYCAFHKHANSEVQKPPSQLRFSLPSIIITITSNEP